MVARKLNLKLTFEGMSDRIMHTERIHYRFEVPATSSSRTNRTKPYAGLSANAMTAFDDFAWDLYEISESTVAIWLGDINFTVYKKRYQTADFVAISELKLFGTEKCFAIERWPDNVIRRLAFFSVHPMYFFYNRPTPKLRVTDTLWNITSMEVDWDRKHASVSILTLLWNMKVAEITHNVTIPTQKLPLRLKQRSIDGYCAFDNVKPFITDSPVIQMLNAKNRAAAALMKHQSGGGGKEHKRIGDEVRAMIGSYEYKRLRLAKKHPEWAEWKLHREASDAKWAHDDFAQKIADKKARLTEFKGAEKAKAKKEEEEMKKVMAPLEFQMGVSQGRSDTKPGRTAALMD